VDDASTIIRGSSEREWCKGFYNYEKIKINQDDDNKSDNLRGPQRNFSEGIEKRQLEKAEILG